MAPAGTPRAVIDQLHAALVKALNDPAVKDNLAKQGAEVVASTPEEYDQFNRAEIAKWIKVVAAAGITPNTPGEASLAHRWFREARIRY